MDHYKVLGLDKNANKEEIKEAFRKLALKFHPDKHSNSSKFIRDNAIHKFKQASEAYEVLIDDRKRADYNQRFGGHSRGSGSGSGYGYHPSYSYNRARNETPRYSPPTSVSKKGGFDFDLALRFLTSRGFLLNLAVAGVLLGAVAIIDASGETLWKMQNSGKSFEEAVESIEKKKRKEEKR